MPPIAATQAGVFTRAQARATGWSAKQEARLLRRGERVRVVGGSYVRAGTPVDLVVRATAARLLTGGVLSHRSAAVLWQLPVADDGRVHVTVRPQDNPLLAGLMVDRRQPIDDAELDLVDGALVASRVRTLADRLGTLPPLQAQHLLDRTLLRRWADPGDLDARVRIATGLRGTPPLLRLRREAARGARSEPERRLRLRLRLILQPTRIRGWRAGVRLDALGIEVDVLVGEARLVLRGRRPGPPLERRPVPVGPHPAEPARHGRLHRAAAPLVGHHQVNRVAATVRAALRRAAAA